MDEKPTYDELEQQLRQAEQILSALRNEQVDAVIGETDVSLLRFSKMERALRESEERLRLVTESVRIGMWVWDLDSGRVDFSDQVKLLFGMEREADISPDTLASMVHPDDMGRIRAEFEAYRERVGEHESECRVVWKDGSVHWLLLKGQTIADGQGRPTRNTGVVLDITRRKQAERDLRKAHALLEERVRERTAELDATNSELQERAQQLSRLASELAVTEQRERQRLATILHDHLQQMLAAAKYELMFIAQEIENKEHVQTLTSVAELIDKSIQESRSLSVELSPPILHEGGLIAGLKWLGRWMNEKYGLKVDLELVPQADLKRADLNVLLFHCARELLFNVVKHAQTERALVGLSYEPDANELCVSVRDEGAGFDIEQMKRRAAQSVEGGFGLFSMRERLAAYNGYLEMWSEPGKGSTFRLCIPLPPEEAEEPTEEVKKTVYERLYAGAEGGKKKKIRLLLVDDHAIMRRGLTTMLRREPDMEIAGEASSGQEAIEAAHRLVPDIVLMDYTMPGMNGAEATRIIRKDLPQVKVIGLSMFDKADRGGPMLDAGAAAYASKSDSPDLLLAAIRQVYAEESAA